MFKPLNNRLLIKPEEKPKETSSGLLLADKTQEKPMIGIVVVGNKDVKKGDRVLFSRYGFDEVTIDEEIYAVVSENNILGIF